jgi:hypothetical protein
LVGLVLVRQPRADHTALMPCQSVQAVTDVILTWPPRSASPTDQAVPETVYVS